MCFSSFFRFLFVFVPNSDFFFFFHFRPADLGFHLFPAALLLIDLFLLSPPWTVRPLTACKTACSIAVLYFFWVEHCYSHNKWYPYPLLEMLDTKQRALLFGSSAVGMTGVTMLLKRGYELVNGASIKEGLSANESARLGKQKRT